LLVKDDLGFSAVGPPRVNLEVRHDYGSHLQNAAMHFNSLPGTPSFAYELKGGPPSENVA